MTTVPEKVEQAYGRLPAGWRLEKLKFFADVRNSNVDKTIADGEEPVRLCNYTDVYYNDRITPDLEFMQGSATEAEIEKFQLKRGQVIVTKDSESWDDIGIPALVAEDMPGVVCGYHLSVFEPNGVDLDGGYLAWLCRSEPLNDQFKLGANGVTRFGLGQYPMKNALVALPPLKTQQRIARFLDEKTARIDGLIEKKRALLDRLTEMRQALITRAVTKGLDPDAPMKPSGIDWLGDIPAHWDVKRLRFLGSTRYGLGEPPAQDADGIPFIRATDIYRGKVDLTSVQRVARDDVPWQRNPILKAGEILVVRSGAYTGDSALVTDDISGFLAGYDMVFTPLTVRPEFLAFTLLAKFMVEGQILLARQRAAQPHLNAEELGNFICAVPPIDEQVTMSERLRRHVDDIEKTSSKISSSIDSLHTYRSAVITAAVTGQIADLA
ncbi:hypothetical protein FJ951_23885 [Mesorhizobium sp. B2-2-3]|uniref:restriction endonuclease subunit S n=1 Tax=Mesorhizobium sp. B2-2-3 TaxID=2589963 RepID=UPI00112BCD1C|nr:restriction endonuclease subunit S [Mesorhizobium sp. B2-2-3]TPM42453.1 hypothetical protein FJ951_23885 [Mesorhizobium sp. B2-2-3]